MSSPVVLVIANPFEARLVSRAVEGNGLRAAVAEGGEGVIDKLDEVRPQVAVLAQGLYYADEREVLAALRERAPGLPVLLIWDGRTPQSQLASDEVLGRPINPTLLVEKLKQLVSPPPPSIEAPASADDAWWDETPLPAPAPATAAPAVLPAEEAVANDPAPVPIVETPSGRHVELPALGDVLGPAARRRERPSSPRPPGPEVNAERVAALLSAVTGTAQPLANPNGAIPRSASRRDTRSGRVVAGEPAEAPPEHPESGELEREGLPSLLVRLHRAGFTGCLTLRRGEGEKRIFFDGGFPVYAASNLPHDALGELLRREGRITREQHARAQRIGDGAGRRTVEVLVELNALKRDETFKILRHHAEEIIYSAFGWERGAWRLGRELPSLDDRVSIGHPFAIALEGIRRKYGLERLVHAVGPTDRAFAATPLLFAITADAGLSTSERDAAQLLRRGPKTVRELQAGGRLDRIGAYALVYGLLVAGGLSPATAETAAGESGEAVDRERALAKYEQVLEGDYFAVLGVHRTATSYEIRRAWERAAADFAPERFDATVQAELGGKLAEIREVLDEALRALGDEALREAYRAALPPT